MKIITVSDLHLEFAPLVLKNTGDADLLILAGDICVADYFTRSEASPYYEVAEKFREFFDYVSHEFPKVIYIPGNHEHYHGHIENTVSILRDVLCNYNNIYILNNQSITIGNQRIFAGTMWSDLSNPLHEWSARGGMNDFKIIKHNYRKLDPSYTTSVFKEFVELVQDLQPDIVVSHHAPSWQSIHPNFRHGPYAHLNPAYASDLDKMIKQSNIKLWVHGHVHSNFDYMIGNTRIYCNPRGYVKPSGDTENPNFQVAEVLNV